MNQNFGKDVTNLNLTNNKFYVIIKEKEVSMSRTNCKNCGAALDICSSKCAFCGTKNINMTDIDLASGEAANFIFKLPNNFKDAEGKEVFLTMLAIPELQTIEMRSEPTYIYGGWNDTKLAYIDNSTFELGLNLRAVSNPKHNDSLCELTIK